MIRKYLLPILSAAGVIFAIYVVINGQKPTPIAGAATPPPESRFKAQVAGTGLVEASTQNVAVAANVPGVVTDVYVKVGDPIVKGVTPLFKLDDRSLNRTLEIQKSALAQAQAKLDKAKSSPRPEEVPPAQALVDEAEANLKDAESQSKSVEELPDPRAMSREERVHRQFAVNAAKSRLANAQASLALLKAGTWDKDIASASADRDYAQAQVESTQTAIDLLTVKAPVTGEVLQVNVRVGEYAQAGSVATPLMLVGNVDELRVRVDIDENEAWRVRARASADASVRGNPQLHTPLTFEYIEPYVIPKKSLTGESTERVDTRVLQVLYSFKRGSLPVYVGQQMDVFIDTSDAVRNSAATSDTPSTEPATRGAGRDGDQ